MDKGWIKLHRKVLENSFCEGGIERLGFWCYILLLANHSGKSFYIANQKIACNPGQFVTGRKQLSKKMRVSEMKAERWLSCLENEQQIEQQKTNKYRIITVLKWSEYQKDEQQNAQQMNNKRTTDEQQMNTNKNVKNDKNDKNENISKEIGKSYGDPDINKVYEYLKKSIGGTPDGSIQENRRFAHLLLNRFKKDYPDKLPTELIRSLIDLGFQDSFHSKNITSFKYLFYNAQKIIASAKNRINDPKLIRL